tara:strand:- start:477 stop:731 length:255 start_codon:yes stop_codon:yes gene_type:complete
MSSSYDIRKFKLNDKVVLCGSSEFGKQFIVENGKNYEVVTTEKWGEFRVLLRALKEDCETGLVWIGLNPPSRNFTIVSVESSDK